MLNNTDHHSVYTEAIKYLFVCGILTLAIFINNISLGMGLFIGGIASLLNYKIMIYSTEKLFDGNVHFPLFYSFFYLLRLAAVTLVILFGVKLEAVNLFTAVIGLLWVRISMVAQALIALLQKK